MTTEQTIARIGALTTEAEDLAKTLKHRKVRVISNFNGQAVGTSKPSLKGRVFTVIAAGPERHGVSLYLDYKHTTSVRASEVEFLS